MGHSVMVSAQERKIFDVGQAALVPVVDVVGVAPGDGSTAAGEHAATVAYGEGSPLVGAGISKGSAHAERITRRADFQRPDDAGGNEPPKCGGRDRQVVLVGEFAGRFVVDDDDFGGGHDTGRVGHSRRAFQHLGECFGRGLRSAGHLHGSAALFGVGSVPPQHSVGFGFDERADHECEFADELAADGGVAVGEWGENWLFAGSRAGS